MPGSVHKPTTAARITDHRVELLLSDKSNFPMSEPIVTPVPPASAEAPDPEKKKKRRPRKKKADSSSAPSASSDRPAENPTKSSGFGDGNKILESFGLGISGRYEEVFSAPNTEGYFQFVDQCYEELISVKPEVRWIFTRAEWMHVHALLLYARVSEVYFQVTGKKQAPPVRVPLPYDVRIFQPIWAILSDIGIVEDTDLKVRYIPVPMLPSNEAIDSPDDIASVLACTMYDWKKSWDDVKTDRTSLDTERSSEGLLPLTMEEVKTKPLTRSKTDEIRDILIELRHISQAKYHDIDANVADRKSRNVSVGIVDTSNKFVTFQFEGGGITFD